MGGSTAALTLEPSLGNPCAPCNYSNLRSINDHQGGSANSHAPKSILRRVLSSLGGQCGS